MITERSRSVTGGNIGADVTYKLRDTGNVAVGLADSSDTRAPAPSVIVMQTDVDTDVGGVQVGFGVRVRF